MLTHHSLTVQVLNLFDDAENAFGNTVKTADLVNAFVASIMSAEAVNYQHAYELGRADGAAGYTTNEPDTASVLVDERMDRNAERATLVQEVTARRAARPFTAPEAFYPSLPTSDESHGITFPASVRSDTYAIDYGRTLGAKWIARSSQWHADDSAPTGFHGSTVPNSDDLAVTGYVNPA